MRSIKIYLVLIAFILLIPGISQARDPNAIIPTSTKIEYDEHIIKCTTKESWVDIYCIEKIITANKADLSLCDYSFNPSNKFHSDQSTGTRDGCYDDALKIIKPNYSCDELRSSNNRRWCYLERCKTTPCCNKIDDIFKDERSYCKAKVAVATQDTDLCLKTGNFYCIEALFKDRKTSLPNDTCKDILPQQEKTRCIDFLVQKNQDPTPCYYFKTDSENFGYCIKLLLDEKKCNLIKNDLLKDHCYDYISSKTKNYQLCSRIKTLWLKQNCKTKQYNYLIDGYNTSIHEIIVNLVFLIALYILYLAIRKKEGLFFLIPATGMSMVITLLCKIIPDIFHLALKTVPKTAPPIYETIIIFGLRITDLWILGSTYAFSSIIPYKWMSILLVNILGFLLLAILSYIPRKTLSNEKLLISLVVLWIVTHVLLGFMTLFAFAAASI
ncbi:MAG: hypothetical protein ABIH87_03530 [bacterium]